MAFIFPISDLARLPFTEKQHLALLLHELSSHTKVQWRCKKSFHWVTLLVVGIWGSWLLPWHKSQFVWTQSCLHLHSDSFLTKLDPASLKLKKKKQLEGPEIQAYAPPRKSLWGLLVNLSDQITRSLNPVCAAKSHDKFPAQLSSCSHAPLLPLRLLSCRVADRCDRRFFYQNLFHFTAWRLISCLPILHH